MSLNIKNEETCKLAVQLAKITGESMTQAVTQAIQERLFKLEKNDELAEELLAIGRDCASRLKEPYLSVDHGDLLYDELGLPR